MFNIFSSYLHEQLLSLDTEKIKKDILNLKSKDKGKIISNYGGWQSENFLKINENFKDLFNKININVQNIEKNLSLSKKLKFKSLWYNVNSLGSFNRPHNHFGDVISGVYYVSTPKNSGNLIFQHFDINKHLTYKFIKNYNKYNSTTWTIFPKENLCVLFPSYLTHYVEPNLNKKERISISFNYGF